MRHFEVSTETRLGPGEQLFSFLAACIETFLAEEVAATAQEQQQELSLGFTFSFPLVQESLVAARLVSWTKSFNCPGVEGEEVVGLLQAAIDRRGLTADLKAVTTATSVMCVCACGIAGGGECCARTRGS